MSEPARARDYALNIHLHRKQAQAFISPATEILYGGAAGGGKSWLMRAASIIWCAEIAGLQAYLFRRVHEDLTRNHMDGPKGYRMLLGPWVDAGWVQIVADEIRFWNDSKIILCHCKDEDHRYKYLGAEIHVLLIDELTTFSEKIYRFLRSRVRMVGVEVPAHYQGRFPRILCSSNPGNVGHHWVKRTFVDSAGEGEIYETDDAEAGLRRQFIRARLEDNPSMAEDDPTYRQRLRGLGSAQLVRAMEEGDWNVVEGAFFDCWSERLVLRPFEVPQHWMRFRSYDHGTASPFAVHWWAVADGDPVLIDGRERWLPRGALVCYREWYGAKPPAGSNQGLKISVEQTADEIRALDRSEVFSYSVADPRIFADEGGATIAQRFSRRDVRFRPANNRRVSVRAGKDGPMGGWDMMRERMIGTAEGEPMLYFVSTCREAIRTIPLLQHDEDRPEDVDTDSEDHAADSVRYACMSRPWVRDKPAASTEPPPGSFDAIAADPQRPRSTYRRGAGVPV